ncbi:hypothetical protein OG936_31055 [Streptomyces sp. NBC_00846]|uniref:hypothetical protein n=1 Tax=Streptomyces sp. NBC_00846 TaxID=2975849 RepID=UPI00386ECDC0|nr:hypothetical protein OG936_31055 [Streptomyces sp. NBC_00846]
MTVKQNKITIKKSQQKRVKPEKRQRASHKVCHHCGQVRTNATTKRPKVTGLAARRAAKAVQPIVMKPLDAAQVIKGIVAALPGVLDGLEVDKGSGASSFIAGAVRTAVLAEFRTRAQFVGRLSEIDALLHAQSVPSEVRGAMAEHLSDLQVSRITDCTRAELFVVTEGEGECLEVLRPAYVDEATGKLALSGQARRFDRPAATLDGTEGGGAQ